MSFEFEPKFVELRQRGTTAALFLDQQRDLTARMVEEVLSRVDSLVINHKLTPDAALGACHELAAYRRMVAKHLQDIQTGRKAAAEVK